MSENPNPNPDPAPELEPDDAAELAALVVETDDGKGGKVKSVPLAKFLDTKKAAKEATKRVKELEPIAAETQALRERLEAAAPFISAITDDPTLRAEAIRRVKGGGTPAPQTDTEAKDYAEDWGIYLSDGITPDVVKARRMLDRENSRVQKLTERMMGPLANLTLGEKASTNVREAKAMLGNDGAPLATAESIDEVANQIPAHLLADPRVVELVVNNAIGVDRRKGRTPKPIDEPLHLDAPGGHRRSEPTVDPDMKARLERLGLTEKEYLETGSKLENAVATRKGFVLGR